MSKHILYTFRRCPYAIRARMALAYANITCELRELILKDKPQDMLKQSPKGTVPVLITADGTVINESLDVMQWALQQNDPEHWLTDQANSLHLIQNFDKNFKPLLDRYKYADRHPDLSESEHREATLDMITSLDQRLNQNKYLLDQQQRFADVAIFPFIRQYAFVDKAWFDQMPFVHLQKWLENQLKHPLFLKVMPKYKLYNDGFSYSFPDGQTLQKPQMN